MTIFGLDFSHYDAVPDGARVVSEGFSFMTHKAGGDAADPELGAWWAALKLHRDQVLLGAYWVLYPGHPEARADAFLRRLDATCPGWQDGPFMLQVDCEKWNGDAASVPNRFDIKDFCDRLVAKMPKLRPIVYAPKWVYGDSLAGLGYPLWASSYVSGAGSAAQLYPGDTSNRWAAYSGQAPAILQFTSSANALGQTTCDANAYRGTRDQLVALLAPGWSQDMTAPTAADNAKATWADYRIKNAYSGVMQSPETLLSYAASATGIAGYVDTKLAPRFQAIADFLATMAANAVTEADVAALQTSISQVDESVLADLADAGRTDQEVADALRAALGDRAAAVGALLAGPA